MEKSKLRKVICVVLLVLALLPLVPVVSCAVCVSVDPEGAFGRYSPYREEEVLRILKLEYGKEFELLESKDTGSCILHTVYPKDMPELLFTFTDSCDGFAGWYADDDYGDAVLLYCAKRSGLDGINEADVCWYPVIYYGDDDVAALSAKLKTTFEMYFEIFDHCRGDITRYSTYHPNHEGRHTEFRLERQYSGYIPNSAQYVLCSQGYDGYLDSLVVFTDRTDYDGIENGISTNMG